MTRDQKITTANNMIRYGGGFASALGHALLSADASNTKRLESAFPELLDGYLYFGNTKKQEDE